MPDRIASLYGFIPQRPGAARPDKEGRVEIRIATVKKVRKADFAVDIMLDAPTKKNPDGQHGLLHEGCQVISPGGTLPSGTTWGMLAIPQVGSQVLAIFLANRVRPFVLGGILWPKADTKTPALVAKVANDDDWVLVHPSGVEVTIRGGSTVPKEVSITQPSGASLTLKTNGDVQISQKAGQKVYAGATATDKVVLETILTTAWGSAWAAFLASYNFHTHTTPAGPSGPPLPTATTPTLSGHGSAVVYGQPT